MDRLDPWIPHVLPRSAFVAEVRGETTLAGIERRVRRWLRRYAETLWPRESHAHRLDDGALWAAAIEGGATLGAADLTQLLQGHQMRHEGVQRALAAAPMLRGDDAEAVARREAVCRWLLPDPSDWESWVRIVRASDSIRMDESLTTLAAAPHFVPLLPADWGVRLERARRTSPQLPAAWGRGASEGAEPVRVGQLRYLAEIGLVTARDDATLAVIVTALDDDDGHLAWRVLHHEASGEGVLDALLDRPRLAGDVLGVLALDPRVRRSAARRGRLVAAARALGGPGGTESGRASAALALARLARTRVGSEGAGWALDLLATHPELAFTLLEAEPGIRRRVEGDDALRSRQGWLLAFHHLRLAGNDVTAVARPPLGEDPALPEARSADDAGEEWFDERRDLPCGRLYDPSDYARARVAELVGGALGAAGTAELATAVRDLWPRLEGTMSWESQIGALLALPPEVRRGVLGMWVRGIPAQLQGAGGGRRSIKDLLATLTRAATLLREAEAALLEETLAAALPALVAAGWELDHQLALLDLLPPEVEGRLRATVSTLLPDTVRRLDGVEGAGRLVTVLDGPGRGLVGDGGRWLIELLFADGEAVGERWPLALQLALLQHAEAKVVAEVRETMIRRISTGLAAPAERGERLELVRRLQALGPRAESEGGARRAGPRRR